MEVYLYARSPNKMLLFFPPTLLQWSCLVTARVKTNLFVSVGTNTFLTHFKTQQTAVVVSKVRSGKGSAEEGRDT